MLALTLGQFYAYVRQAQQRERQALRHQVLAARLAALPPGEVSALLKELDR